MSANAIAVTRTTVMKAAVSRLAATHAGPPACVVARRLAGWLGACTPPTLPARSTAALRPRPLAGTKREAQIKRSKYFVRLYSPSELSALMRRAGFQSVQAFGQDGEAYSLYGKRLILVASKV